MQFEDFNDHYFDARVNDMRERHLMHELDREYISRRVTKSVSVKKSTLLDIGCADGAFVEPFILQGHEVYGIEPNEAQRNLARAKGVKIVESISEVPGLDLVIIRGTLHHLPDWRASVDEIFEKFQIDLNKNTKWLFILAEPNSSSWIYQKFGRLPAVEEDSQFKSNYKIFSAGELREYFVNRGAFIHVQFPYLKTPYQHFWRDLIKVSRMLVLRRYERTPWFGNMFNMAVEVRISAESK